MKMQTADWLLYACEELARMKKMQPIIKIIKRVRVRIKHGVKRELIPLLAFKGVGRSRARKLFKNNIQKVSDVTTAEYSQLASIVGVKLASKIKEQVGEKISEEEEKSVKKTTKQSVPKHSSQSTLSNF
jgi:helicase